MESKSTTRNTSWWLAKEAQKKNKLYINLYQTPKFLQACTGVGLALLCSDPDNMFIKICDTTDAWFIVIDIFSGLLIKLSLVNNHHDIYIVIVL